MIQASNIVDYNDVIPDGFYDVCGVSSDERIYLSEKMPPLGDLQKLPISDTSKIEVCLVDRGQDHYLTAMEAEAEAAKVSASVEAEDEDSRRTHLAQKIALIVADHMGGPVGSETDILFRWQQTSRDLKHTTQNVVLMLGNLRIGLTRHRALLFKVRNCFHLYLCGIRTCRSLC